MKKYSIVAYAVIIATNLIALCGAGQENTANHLNFDQYKTMSRMDMIQHIEDLSAERFEIEGDVEDELQNGGSTQAILAAIAIADLYRVERAAIYLAGMIDFRDAEAADRPQMPYNRLWHEYPAVDALASIGYPAIPYLIDNLRKSDKPTVRHLSVQVLCNILGAGPARECLQEEIDKETGVANEAIVSRLRAAIPLLDAPVKEPPVYLQAFDQISTRLSWEICGLLILVAILLGIDIKLRLGNAKKTIQI